MSTPNQPQDPYSAEGRGSGDQSGGVPPYPGGTPADGGQGTQGGVPQYGSYAGGGDQGQGGGYGQGGYGGPAYPGGGQQGYGGYYPKNNLAVWSLVLGIVGFFVCWLFTSIPGIIVGSKAKQAVARGEANNGSLANAGYIVSWVVTILNVLWVVVGGILLAVGAVNWNFDTYQY
jgi:hypothetical protein